MNNNNNNNINKEYVVKCLKCGTGSKVFDFATATELAETHSSYGNGHTGSLIEVDSDIINAQKAGAYD